MINKKTIFQISACLIVCSFILGIRKFMDYPQEVIAAVKMIEDGVAGIITVLKLQQIVEFLSKLPVSVVFCSIGAVFFAVGMAAVKLLPKKVKMGSDIVYLNLDGVIKMGLLIYVMRLVLTLVFVFSVVGIPVAIVITAVFAVINLIGFVPVAVFIGHTIQEMANGSDRRLIYNYTLGALFMLLCINVYAVGSTFMFFIFPVLSFGAFAMIVSRKLLGAKLPPDESGEGKNKFDREKIRDIITNGL